MASSTKSAQADKMIKYYAVIGYPNGQDGASLTSHLVNNPYISWVTNHAGFDSTRLLAEQAIYHCNAGQTREIRSLTGERRSAEREGREFESRPDQHSGS